LCGAAEEKKMKREDFSKIPLAFKIEVSIISRVGASPADESQGT